MTEPNVDIVIDCHDLEGLLDFWGAALDYREIHIKDNYTLLLPEKQSHPPVILQRVPEPKTSKTRVHFDIRVDDVEAKANQLEALGARRIDVGQPERERGVHPDGRPRRKRVLRLSRSAAHLTSAFDRSVRRVQLGSQRGLLTTIGDVASDAAGKTCGDGFPASAGRSAGGAVDRG